MINSFLGYLHIISTNFIGLFQISFFFANNNYKENQFLIDIQVREKKNSTKKVLTEVGESQNEGVNMRLVNTHEKRRNNNSLGNNLQSICVAFDGEIFKFKRNAIYYFTCYFRE